MTLELLASEADVSDGRRDVLIRNIWLDPASRAERGGRRSNPMFPGTSMETLQPEAVLIGRRPQ
jgi:hypothetical protein